MTAPTRRSEAGFSLIELLVAMVIAVEILVAALTVFDVHNRMARIQTQITDMQQSLRVGQYDMVRTTRMAGRGGLPLTYTVATTGTATWLQGLALEVRNNLVEDADREVAQGYDDSPLAVKGTDVLITRGCLSSPMFMVNSANPGAFTGDANGDGTPSDGVLLLDGVTTKGLSQVDGLQQFVDGTLSGPLVLMSAIDRTRLGYAEVTSVTGDPATQLTLNLTFVSAADPPNPLIGLPDIDGDGVPDPNFTVGFACVLEEYRYYVRENREIPGDDASRLMPRLARARMIPGTETAFADDVANLSLDLADEIIDLQVALGFDSDFDLDGALPGAFDDDPDALGNDDVVYEGADNAARGNDDWLWNSTDDDPTDGRWLAHGTPTNFQPVDLLYARITTVARTARPDPRYIAPDFDTDAGHDYVEDNDYAVAPADVFQQGENRMHRRRVVQTIVDLRGL